MPLEGVHPSKPGERPPAKYRSGMFHQSVSYSGYLVGQIWGIWLYFFDFVTFAWLGMVDAIYEAEGESSHEANMHISNVGGPNFLRL